MIPVWDAAVRVLHWTLVLTVAGTTVRTTSATEVKRGKDACTAYVEKICACSTKNPDRRDVKEACKLAQGYPEAIEVGLNVAMGSDSAKRDVVSSQSSVRKAMAKCIEEAGKLSLLGC